MYIYIYKYIYIYNYIYIYINAATNFVIVYMLLCSSSKYESEAIERTQLESVRKVPIYILY